MRPLEVFEAPKFVLASWRKNQMVVSMPGMLVIAVIWCIARGLQKASWRAFCWEFLAYAIALHGLFIWYRLETGQIKIIFGEPVFLRLDGPAVLILTEGLLLAIAFTFVIWLAALSIWATARAVRRRFSAPPT